MNLICINRYLTGTKKYLARGEFGFETTTLDVEGNITKTAPSDHITIEKIQEALPSFTGAIMQKPPIFSALKRDGKKLYEHGREGKSEEDIKIEPREVNVYKLELLNEPDTKLPSFYVDIECGKGTYVRSLIRDIGYKLESVATTTLLRRTQQGQFTIEHTLTKEELSSDSIYNAIDQANKARRESDKHP